MQSGRVIASLPAVGDCDDVFYDSAQKRIYASGGAGAIFVFEQHDANRYTRIANIPTVRGARTSFYSPELHRFYIAVPQQGAAAAAVRVYDPE